MVNNQSRVDFRDANGDQNVLQFYHKLMARQLRGYPLAYRIIAAAKNNDRYWDATLHRAVMETLILGSTDSPADNPYKQMRDLADSMTADSEINSGTTYDTTQATNIGPGNILTFQKGGIKFTDLKTPSNNFDKMQAAYIDMVGMATDVPPECVMSRYSTSYTAHKGALNDFIQSYMQKRRAFIQNVNNQVVLEIAKYLFYSRLIEMPNPDFFSNPIVQMATIAGNWLGPVPGSINPLQEVNAKALEVANAFRTRADAAADYGNEFDNMVEEWGQQEKEWSEKSPAQKAQALGNDMDKQDDQSGEPQEQPDEQGEEE
jgi:capsid protein